MLVAGSKKTMISGRRFLNCRSGRMGEKMEGKIDKDGYHKNARRIMFAVEKIEICQGKKEWGADLGKFYFVIELGEVI